MTEATEWRPDERLEVLAQVRDNDPQAFEGFSPGIRDALQQYLAERPPENDR